MRFVPIKTVEQQGEAVTHKARQLLIKQQTMTRNSLRGLMAEFGIVVPQEPNISASCSSFWPTPRIPASPRWRAPR